MLMKEHTIWLQKNRRIFWNVSNTLFNLLVKDDRFCGLLLCWKTYYFLLLSYEKRKHAELLHFFLHPLSVSHSSLFANYIFQISDDFFRGDIRLRMPANAIKFHLKPKWSSAEGMSVNYCIGDHIKTQSIIAPHFTKESFFYPAWLEALSVYTYTLMDGFNQKCFLIKPWGEEIFIEYVL